MKTALISGANRGIGLAVAQALAAKGDIKVLAGCRAPKDGEAAVQGLKNCRAVALDLGEGGLLATQMAAIVKKHGPIDILVNNAGVYEHGGVLEVSEAAWALSQRVNLQAPFELIRILAPGMVDRGYGRIVNVSSGLGSFSGGLGGAAAYSISKASLNALTLVLSQELPKTVKVNAVCPGWVKTRMGGEGATREPAKGAEGIVWAATLPEGGPTGGFFRDGKKIDW